LTRENTDFKHKFVLYCKNLEEKLKREAFEERAVLEKRIVGYRTTIEKLKEEYKFEVRRKESVEVQKLRLEITSWEARFNFLAERFYLSDLENRALQIECGTRQETIDVKIERHERLRISKIEVEEELQKIYKLIEQYKVKITELEYELVEYEKLKVIHRELVIEHERCEIDKTELRAEIKKRIVIIEQL